MKLHLTLVEAQTMIQAELLKLSGVVTQGAFPAVEIHNSELEQEHAVAQRQLNVARDRVAWLEAEFANYVELVNLLVNPAVQRVLYEHRDAWQDCFLAVRESQFGFTGTHYHVALGDDHAPASLPEEVTSANLRDAVLAALRQAASTTAPVEDLPAATPADVGPRSPMAEILMRVDADNAADGTERVAGNE